MRDTPTVELIPVQPDRPVTDAVAYLFTSNRELPVRPIRVPRWKQFVFSQPGTSALHFSRNAVGDWHHLLVMISPKELAGIPSGDEASWVGASWNDRRWY
jgi:hypothetical protein